MRRLDHRTCFVLSTAALVMTCLCCGALGLALALQQTVPSADAATLKRRMEERLLAAKLAHQDLVSLWSRLQADQPAPCAESPEAVPPVFVMRVQEERDHPQLAEAAAQLNHAIDEIEWTAKTWEAICAASAPSAGAIADGQSRLDEAREALDNAEAALSNAPGS